MRTICSREIFTKKCRQQQNFDSDPKEAWHYNHVTFTPIAKNFMLYCRLIYMLSLLHVRLTINVKVGIPESFKVGCYPYTITGSSHLNVECTSANSRIWHFLPAPRIETYGHPRDYKNFNASGLCEFRITKILTDWQSIYIHCSLHTRKFNLISSIHSNNEAIYLFTKRLYRGAPVRYLIHEQSCWFVIAMVE